jgi:hypothetical protein
MGELSSTHCSTVGLTDTFSFTPSTLSSTKARVSCDLPIEQRRELLEEALLKVQYPVLRSISFNSDAGGFFAVRAMACLITLG